MGLRGRLKSVKERRADAKRRGQEQREADRMAYEKGYSEARGKAMEEAGRRAARDSAKHTSKQGRGLGQILIDIQPSLRQAQLAMNSISGWNPDAWNPYAPKRRTRRKK